MKIKFEANRQHQVGVGRIDREEVPVLHATQTATGRMHKQLMVARDVDGNVGSVGDAISIELERDCLIPLSNLHHLGIDQTGRTGRRHHDRQIVADVDEGRQWIDGHPLLVELESSVAASLPVIDAERILIVQSIPIVERPVAALSKHGTHDPVNSRRQMPLVEQAVKQFVVDQLP